MQSATDNFTRTLDALRRSEGEYAPSEDLIAALSSPCHVSAHDAQQYSTITDDADGSDDATILGAILGRYPEYQRLPQQQKASAKTSKKDSSGSDFDLEDENDDENAAVPPLQHVAFNRALASVGFAHRTPFDALFQLQQAEATRRYEAFLRLEMETVYVGLAGQHLLFVAEDKQRNELFNVFNGIKNQIRSVDATRQRKIDDAAAIFETAKSAAAVAAAKKAKEDDLSFLMEDETEPAAASNSPEIALAEAQKAFDKVISDANQVAQFEVKSILSEHFEPFARDGEAKTAQRREQFSSDIAQLKRQSTAGSVDASNPYLIDLFVLSTGGSATAADFSLLFELVEVQEELQRLIVEAREVVKRSAMLVGLLAPARSSKEKGNSNSGGDDSAAPAPKVPTPPTAAAAGKKVPQPPPPQQQLASSSSSRPPFLPRPPAAGGGNSLNPNGSGSFNPNASTSSSVGNGGGIHHNNHNGSSVPTSPLLADTYSDRVPVGGKTAVHVLQAPPQPAATAGGSGSGGKKMVPSPPTVKPTPPATPRGGGGGATTTSNGGNVRNKKAASSTTQSNSNSKTTTPATTPRKQKSNATDGTIPTPLPACADTTKDKRFIEGRELALDRRTRLTESQKWRDIEAQLKAVDADFEMRRVYDKKGNVRPPLTAIRAPRPSFNISVMLDRRADGTIPEKVLRTGHFASALREREERAKAKKKAEKEKRKLEKKQRLEQQQQREKEKDGGVADDEGDKKKKANNEKNVANVSVVLPPIKDSKKEKLKLSPSSANNNKSHSSSAASSRSSSASSSSSSSRSSAASSKRSRHSSASSAKHSHTDGGGDLSPRSDYTADTSSPARGHGGDAANTTANDTSAAVTATDYSPTATSYAASPSPDTRKKKTDDDNNEDGDDDGYSEQFEGYSSGFESSPSPSKSPRRPNNKADGGDVSLSPQSPRSASSSGRASSFRSATPPPPQDTEEEKARADHEEEL